ncbi:hypothetical protein BD779DRAFT_1475988 [Infundibulicybe gibba]|nr:hypothetical protein BD779DRAFT_1475988 [Infundibulicybe gibba]
MDKEPFGFLRVERMPNNSNHAKTETNTRQEEALGDYNATVQVEFDALPEVDFKDVSPHNNLQFVKVYETGKSVNRYFLAAVVMKYLARKIAIDIKVMESLVTTHGEKFGAELEKVEGMRLGVERGAVLGEFWLGAEVQQERAEEQRQRAEEAIAGVGEGTGKCLR